MSAPDLDQILPLLGENAVLGLGEPTHGSANAFAWKLEILAELARRGMLAAFAIEDSLIAGRLLDQALRAGGDVDEHLAAGSSIWRTETIRDGLKRLAEIAAEASPEARPRGLGIDISAPHRTAGALLELGHDGPLLRRIAAREELGREDVAALETLCTRVRASADPGTAELGRNLHRHLDAYLRAPDLSRLHRRDAHMAHTLLEQLPHRGITVVWAHNEHIARNPDNWGGPAMGAVLAGELGERYVPVGMMCGGGEARAVDPSTGDDAYRAVPLPPMRAGTTDAALLDLGVPFVTTAEFPHPGPRRFLGWLLDTSLYVDPEATRTTFEVERPSSDFDALVALPTSVADVSAPLAPR